jgi:hypothetical protein
MSKILPATKFLVLSLLSIASFGAPLISFAQPTQLSTESFPLSDFNFGVVKRNSTYQIYRSEILGTQGLNAVLSHLKKNNLPAPKTIIYMNTDGFSDKDLRAMEEFQAQQTLSFEFFHSFRYDYRTYLDGGNPSSPSEDIDDGRYLGASATAAFGAIVDPAHDGGEDAFKRILNVVLDPSRQPVLFHCLGGRHRTGMVAMALRYIEGGAWLEGSYTVRVPPFFQKRDLNLAQHEYYLHNPSQFRGVNISFVEGFFQNSADAKEYVGKYRAQLLAP